MSSLNRSDKERPMGIRDTSKFFGTAQADMILADARSGGQGGSGAFIEEMEREGQAQLVTF